MEINGKKKKPKDTKKDFKGRFRQVDSLKNRQTMERKKCQGRHKQIILKINRKSICKYSSPFKNNKQSL